MMPARLFVQIMSILAAISLISCSGSTADGNKSTSSKSLPCGNDIYTIKWDWAAADPSMTLTGFKIYYGNSASLSKTNALGIVRLGKGSFSAYFKPSSYSITDCSRIYLGITATGSQPESAISEIINLTDPD